MKKPENIEALLVDYAEGNLSSDKLLLVESWLEEHPEDLETVLNWDSTDYHEEVSAISPDFKSRLKLLNMVGVEALMIKELEGDISKEQLAILEKHCNDSVVLEKERSIYGLTKLVYETDRIVYLNKSKLRKSLILSISSSPIFRSAVAASLIATVFWLGLGSPEPNYKVRTAELKAIEPFNPTESPLETIKEEVETSEEFVAIAKAPIKEFRPESNKLKAERPNHSAESSTDQLALKKMTIKSTTLKFAPVNRQTLIALHSTNNVVQEVLVEKPEISNEYEGLADFLKSKVLERLPFDISNRSSKEILETELARVSGGKYSVDFDNGKLIAINSPAISWKKE